MINGDDRAATSLSRGRAILITSPDQITADWLTRRLRDGKWRLWDSILAGLRAFDEHDVKQLFPG